MTTNIEKVITLTEPMRSCVVAPQIIAAARDIEAILEAAKLDDGKVINITDMPDEIKLLNKIIADVDEARVSSFRETEEIKGQFKNQIDEKILKPLKDKRDEYKLQIDTHNENVRKLEIAAAIKPSNNVSVSTPIPQAIKVRLKPYVCDCIDLSKVPESYKLTIFNKKKADMDVNCGIRSIEGCRIYRPK